MLKPRKRLVKAKLKEDRLLIFTAKAQGWAAKYQRQLIYAAIAVLVLLGGAVALKMSRAAAQKNASFEELQAREAFLRGDLDDALNRSTAIINDYSGTRSAGVAIALQGRIYQQQGEYDKAEQSYRTVLDHYSSENYIAFGAWIALGDIYYGRGEFQKAAEFYQSAARKFPHHFSAPEAMLSAGRAWKKIGKYDDARRVWRQALKDFPKARAAGDIRNELENVEFMR